MFSVPSVITKDDMLKLDMSEQETVDLTERDLRCPHCRFLITKVFSDTTGHMRVRCNKCKRMYIMNLQFFRTAQPSAIVTLIRTIE